jgi:hypothetical protein
MATIHKTDSSPFRKNTHRKKANVSIMDDPKLHSIAFNCFVHSQSPICNAYITDHLSFRIHMKSEQQKKMEHLSRSKLHNNEDEHIFTDPNCATKKMNMIFADPNCTPKKMNMILTDPNWTMKMKMGILADSNYTNEEDQHPCRSRLRNEEGEHHPCRCGLCNEEDEHVLVDPN